MTQPLTLNSAADTRYGNMARNIVLISVFAIFAALYYWTPMLLDEYTFADMYRGYNNGSEDFSLSALLKYAGEMRQYDNSRLANVMSPFTTVIHPWCDIAPLVSALMATLMLWGAVKISGIRDNTAPLTVFLWAAILIFLPWRNFILVADYTLNYVYASAINLLWLITFLSWRRKRHTACATALMAIFTLVTGMWHEGFSVTILAGLGVDWLASRCRKPAWWWTFAIIYLAGTAYIIFCPGLMDRADRQILNDVHYPTLKLVVELSLCILFAVTTAAAALFRRGRQRLRSAWSGTTFRVMVTAMASGVLLSLIVEHTPRTTFWPTLCAIISALILWHPVISRILSKRLTRATAALLYLLLGAHGVYLITWQHRYYTEAAAIVSQMKANPDGTAFYDIMRPEDLPLATLRIPTYSHWLVSFNTACLDDYLQSKWHTVVPTILREPYKGAVPLAGGDSIMRTGDALWRPMSHDLTYSDLIGAMTVDIHLSDGTHLPDALAHTARFITPAKDTLLYIRPYYINSRDITSAKLIRPRR